MDKPLLKKDVTLAVFTSDYCGAKKGDRAVIVHENNMGYTRCFVRGKEVAMQMDFRQHIETIEHTDNEDLLLSLYSLLMVL
jgi:hypothetical protein